MADEPAWLGSGSWRVSDSVPFLKAFPATAAAAAAGKALSDSGVTAAVNGGASGSPPASASDASASASLPAMRLSLDVEVSSPQPPADGAPSSQIPSRLFCVTYRLLACTVHIHRMTCQPSWRFCVSLGAEQACFPAS